MKNLICPIISNGKDVVTCAKDCVAHQTEWDPITDKEFEYCEIIKGINAIRYIDDS